MLAGRWLGLLRDQTATSHTLLLFIHYSRYVTVYPMRSPANSPTLSTSPAKRPQSWVRSSRFLDCTMTKS